MSQSRLDKKIEGWVADSLDQHSLGEEIEWSYLLQPAQIQGGATVIALTLILVGKGALINEKLPIVMQLPNAPGCTEPMINEMVTKGLETIRNQRSQQLSMGNGQAQGDGTPRLGPGGLQLPDGMS